MKIRFDPDFDGGAWPGPLDGRDAAAGEAWLGELGLLERLETVLGLSGPVPSQAERAAALVPGLQRTVGFWSESADVDPLGSARELLRWRDELGMAGWRGQVTGMPARVAALGGLNDDALPGLPERAWSVCNALSRRSAELGSLELLEPRAALPRVWQAVIARLKEQGTSVVEIALEAAPATGDLLAARERELHPGLDGSLQLLRSDGPWAAAVETAAWLSTRSSLKDVVIISPTPLLDTELRRFGLPTTGARQLGGGSSVLEVLALVLSLGWKPADPAVAAELLGLPVSPVPGRIAYRLRRALAEWPAVGSEDWNEALAEGLGAIDDEQVRERTRERLANIFDSHVGRDGSGYPVAEIRKRTALVRDWLRRRKAVLTDGVEVEFAQSLDEAIAQCRAFDRIVDLAGLAAWSEADLQRFLDEARAGSASERVLPAEAGLASVLCPAALAGPARSVVWWNFTRQSAPRHPRIPFTVAERAQLAGAGIELATPADVAIRHAARWQRPLFQTRESLLLVAPLTDEAGRESHPHPLWDEIGARLAAGTAESKRSRFLNGDIHTTPRAALVTQDLRPVPQAERNWSVPAKLLEIPAPASNSAIEDLVRCPMQWALARVAKLRAPDQIDVEISNLVLGRLAHALLEEVLPAAAGDSSAAGELARGWFDEHAPTRVAGLFLRGNEAEHARVRRILVDSATLFADFIRDSGLELRFTEERLTGTGLGRDLLGIADLVLGPRPVVIDAKWGGLAYRRTALQKGTATQLAFYAHLLHQRGGFDEQAVSVAFFVLSRGRILSTDPALGTRAEVVQGPTHAETWSALEQAFETRNQELQQGILLATAIPEEPDQVLKTDDRVEEGVVVLKPNCQWCDYGGLCGASLEGARG
jgi:RecB family exonuclease